MKVLSIERWGGITLCLALMMACSGGSKVPVRDTVLKPGQSVTATNRFGTARITYVAPATRKFEFDGQSKTIRLTPRPEPFEGRSGIYDPGEAWGPFPPIRIVAEESVINVDNLDQVYFLLRQSSAIMDWVYTPDGLVVGYGGSPARRQVNIEVYQYLVRGQKPHDLRGARPDAIHLTTDTIH